MSTDEIDAPIRRQVETELNGIRRNYGVKLLMAVESGSRAWGFPSPNSDYDVRFFYVRPLEDYLALSPKRDVIELPIAADLDINGWDIRKALGLIMNHNAVASEWLDSPIRYVDDGAIVRELRELVDRHFDPRGYALHYASLGRNNVQRWDASGKTISAKRYFYALRPALSVRALRMNPTRRPPMRLQELMTVCDLPPSLNAEIDRLVEIKSTQREAADTVRSSSIESLILDELDRAKETPSRVPNDSFVREADHLFQSLLIPS